MWIKLPIFLLHLFGKFNHRKDHILVEYGFSFLLCKIRVNFELSIHQVFALVFLLSGCFFHSRNNVQCMNSIQFMNFQEKSFLSVCKLQMTSLTYIFTSQNQNLYSCESDYHKCPSVHLEKKTPSLSELCLSAKLIFFVAFYAFCLVWF